MDRQIMDLIDAEVKKLPPKGKRKDKQYVRAKKRLCPKFPKHIEYLCKAIAKKYDI